MHEMFATFCILMTGDALQYFCNIFPKAEIVDPWILALGEFGLDLY